MEILGKLEYSRLTFQSIQLILKILYMRTLYCMRFVKGGTKMKHIKAIIQPEKLVTVRTALEKTNCYRGIIITDVMGQGTQKGIEQAWRGEKVQIDLIPKIMIDLIVKDEDADNIVNIIYESARTGEIGDGKIFMYHVEKAIRIRTGEEGDIALEHTEGS